MRTIKLSIKASRKLDELLKFLETEWSQKVKQDFILKLDNSFNTICEFPESCQKTDFVKGLYKLVVTKQTSVFYRFDSQRIYVVAIFDNRMNPKKFKKKIK